MLHATQSMEAVAFRPRPLSAAITLAGVELAHRVRKQRHGLLPRIKGRAPSLKDLWDVALGGPGGPTGRAGDRPSPMHQSSSDRFQSAREWVGPAGSVRYPRKISFGGNP